MPCKTVLIEHDNPTASKLKMTLGDHANLSRSFNYPIGVTMPKHIRNLVKFAIWMTIIVICLSPFSGKFVIWLIRWQLEITFLVICAQIFPKRLDGTRPLPVSRLDMLKNGLFWPKTFVNWAYNERMEEILHFVGYFWSAQITFWHWRTLWFTVDRQHWRYGDHVYLITLYGVMFGLTLCLGMFPLMRSQLKESKLNLSEKQQIFIRALFWWITIPRWFLQGDWRILVAYMTALWLVVLLGWNFTDANEAFDQLWGALGRVF